MTAVQPALIPIELLFNDPSQDLVLLSPDGNRLAYLAPHDGILNVHVSDLDGGNVRTLTNFRDRGIMHCSWAPDGEHVLFPRDNDGDENAHLFAVNISTGEARDLTPTAARAEVAARSLQAPGDLVMGLDLDGSGPLHLYRVSIASGEMLRVADNPGFGRWLVTSDLSVWGGLMATPDGGLDVQRANPDGSYTTVLTLGAEDLIRVMMLGGITVMDGGRGLAVVTSRDANTARLVHFNLDTGAQTVLAEDPDVDLGAMLVHPVTGAPQAIQVYKERGEWLVLDESLREDLDTIRKLHRGDFTLFAPQRDRSDTKWIVTFCADDSKGDSFLYDRGTRAATLIQKWRPELEGYELAHSEPFEFFARDGLRIHGYLIFPKHGRRENLPVIIHPHGGPDARDMWYYNRYDQLFADRGYLVVLVNFRGSTGYGKAFNQAGHGEWGRRMHEDVVDAARQLISAGYADPERIGVFGWSYGGYESLICATFGPHDLFRCCAAGVGPVNLVTFTETMPAFWSTTLRQLWNRMLGDPVKDRDLLWSRSPLSHVNEIRNPLYIAYGATDPRVKLSEAEQLIEALEKNGVPHKVFIAPDEGHEFTRQENRLRLAGDLEAFFAEHLGGDRS